MKKILLFFFAIIFCLRVAAQQIDKGQELNTSITASLNTKDRSIDGSLKLEYTNHSPDTLNYIWFLIWPNAFKSDKTAFSEYLLGKRRTDFYFSDKGKKGYINRLDFRSNDVVLKQEDHPQYIDVVKVYLDHPLYPGNMVSITTPFHTKIPYNFDSIGYDSEGYSIKYWYPVPAAYSNGNWSVGPYIGKASVLPEISDVDVTITLPARLNVQTSGHLLDSIRTDTLKRLRYTATDVPDFSFTAGRPLRLREIPHGYHIPAKYEFRDNILSRRIFPMPGYNRYDGLQLGMLIHEPDPSRQFNWFAIPMYALGSKKITGTAGMSYSFPDLKKIKAIETGLYLSAFSTMDGKDSIGKKVYAGLYKITPFVRFELPSASPDIIKSIEFRSFIISERNFTYSKYSVDSFYYPSEGATYTRYVNQLSVDYSNKRVLYPYDASLQLQQGESFYRVNATGNYFFNYAKGGGMKLRLFAAKFGYLGRQTQQKKFETFIYQPKLTAVRGNEDYTYSDYFFGRNEYEGFNSHQVMMRDGGLKLRTDLFQDLQGRSDNWIASMNLNTTLPKLFPVAIPLRIFFDAGTYADAWKPENSDPRFLYVAGLQLSLFNEFLNIYAPLMYSKQFRDRLKSVPEENKFFNRISFSIDARRLNIHSLNKRKM